MRFDRMKCVPVTTCVYGSMQAIHGETLTVLQCTVSKLKWIGRDSSVPCPPIGRLKVAHS